MIFKRQLCYSDSEFPSGHPFGVLRWKYPGMTLLCSRMWSLSLLVGSSGFLFWRSESPETLLSSLTKQALGLQAGSSCLWWLQLFLLLQCLYNSAFLSILPILVRSPLSLAWLSFSLHTSIFSYPLKCFLSANILKRGKYT